MSNIFSFAIFTLILLECEGISFLQKNEYNVSLQVTIENGIIQGREKRTVRGTRYFSYEGIPFAQPPIQSLRFKGPKPAKPWKTKGVLKAIKQSPTCNQLLIRYIHIEQKGIEDCLYLNVYTPKNMQFAKNDMLPVLFWIYGGAFMEGTTKTFGPNNLIDKNLVVVTFNYRLGPFGFLSTEDDASPGNYGLKDQNAALKWVNKNIEKFGGDPRKVTISGHSAGAASVMYHMLSPLSRGLFHAAIAWSGETTTQWANQKRPKSVALDLAMSLGIETDNTTKMLEKLRRVDVEDIKVGQILVSLAHVNILQEGLVFTPCVEPNHPEAFITKKSYEMLKRGDFARIPLMIGTTNMEFGMFAKIFNILRPLLIFFDMSPSSIPNGMEGNSFLANRQIGERIKEKYFESNSISGSTNEELVTLFTDILYTVPITRTIRAMSSYIPIYFFVSTHSEMNAKKIIESLKYPIDVNVKGVVHGEDLDLIWFINNFGTPPKSIGIRKKFCQLWKNFATFGNPTPTYDPKIGTLWPPVTDQNNISYLLIEDDVKIAYNYKKDVIHFWDNLLNEFTNYNVTV